MGKGTTSFGQRNKNNHFLCPRCGRRAFNKAAGQCSACNFPAPKMRKYNWSQKAIRRKTTGTGRMRYLKKIESKRERWAAINRKTSYKARKQLC
mmetsp:Transcript_15654/g.17402  ORF Transcript_15654/g.17402 Transcript_15654/m.17402 type:complete len:94 (-) Transcript_15654:74-355(-)